MSEKKQACLNVPCKGDLEPLIFGGVKSFVCLRCKEEFYLLNGNLVSEKAWKDLKEMGREMTGKP